MWQPACRSGPLLSEPSEPLFPVGGCGVRGEAPHATPYPIPPTTPFLYKSEEWGVGARCVLSEPFPITLGTSAFLAWSQPCPPLPGCMLPGPGPFAFELLLKGQHPSQSPDNWSSPDDLLLRPAGLILHPGLPVSPLAGAPFPWTRSLAGLGFPSLTWAAASALLFQSGAIWLLRFLQAQVTLN